MFRKPRIINPKAKGEIDTGFNGNASNVGGRFIDKSGMPNVQKKGVGIFEKLSWYHVLLAMPRFKFLMVITSFYLFVNLVFGTIYYLIGVEKSAGIVTNSEFHNYLEAFFFSCQAFTVGGYGRISPTNMLINSLCAIESFLGLLSLAVVTGLLYGRFSRPKAYLIYSNKALLTPYKNGNALMFRVAPLKNTSLTDVEVKVTLGLMVEENGQFVNRFYNLTLEYERVQSLVLNWTVVHPIEEASPLYGFTGEDFKNTSGEIIVIVKAFDDMFSNTVVSRTSFTMSEIVVGAKFVPMYHRTKDGHHTVLHLDKISDFESASLN